MLGLIWFGQSRLQPSQPQSVLYSVKYCILIKALATHACRQMSSTTTRLADDAETPSATRVAAHAWMQIHQITHQDACSTSLETPQTRPQWSCTAVWCKRAPMHA